MKLPSEEQVRIAIDWLGYNEGEDGESDACEAVAEYLEHVLTDTILKTLARKAKIPVAKVRERMKQ